MNTALHLRLAAAPPRVAASPPAAAEVPEIMANPAPRAMFVGFGDSSLDLRLLAWVLTLDIGVQAQNALRVAILRKLDAAGIAIPYPQHDPHLYPAVTSGSSPMAGRT